MCLTYIYVYMYVCGCGLVYMGDIQCQNVRKVTAAAEIEENGEY